MPVPQTRNRSALTLIEVVAGLALMGTLLAAIMVAGSAHARQAKAAADKREAVIMLDRLLNAWAQDGLALDKLEKASATAQVSFSAPAIRLRNDVIGSPFVVMIRKEQRPAVFRRQRSDAVVVRLSIHPVQPERNTTVISWVEVLVLGWENQLARLESR